MWGLTAPRGFESRSLRQDSGKFNGLRWVLEPTHPAALWRASILVVALPGCGAVPAHKRTDSYLALRATGTSIDGPWDIARLP